MSIKIKKSKSNKSTNEKKNEIIKASFIVKELVHNTDDERFELVCLANAKFEFTSYQKELPTYHVISKDDEYSFDCTLLQILQKLNLIPSEVDSKLKSLGTSCKIKDISKILNYASDTIKNNCIEFTCDVNTEASEKGYPIFKTLVVNTIVLTELETIEL